MSITDNFRKQHDDLLGIAGKISAYLETNRLSTEAEAVHKLLIQLFGKLNVHLAMEDKSLYPKLVNHSDPTIKAMAERFISEMGGIGEAVKTYRSKWSQTRQIEADPKGFIGETKGLFKALSERIKRENNELYKRFDQL